MAKEARDAVADFLVRKASPELVEGLTVLAGLDLPIHDERSFRDRLDEVANQADESSESGVEALRGRFEARDFPILSVESAFEKYWGELHPAGFQLPELELPEEPPDPTGPPMCEMYERAFVTRAAECACRAYVHARSLGYNSHRAAIMGYSAGKHAEETGRCRA